MSEGFTRPPVEILPDLALAPSGNVIAPPPNRFTHETRAPAPYHYGPAPDQPPDGTFDAGVSLLLLARLDDACWVADARGLYVRVDCSALRELPPR